MASSSGALPPGVVALLLSDLSARAAAIRDAVAAATCSPCAGTAGALSVPLQSALCGSLSRRSTVVGDCCVDILWSHSSSNRAAVKSDVTAAAVDCTNGAAAGAHAGTGAGAVAGGGGSSSDGDAASLRPTFTVNLVFLAGGVLWALRWPANSLRSVALSTAEGVGEFQSSDKAKSSATSKRKKGPKRAAGESVLLVQPDGSFVDLVPKVAVGTASTIGLFFSQPPLLYKERSPADPQPVWAYVQGSQGTAGSVPVDPDTLGSSLRITIDPRYVPLATFQSFLGVMQSLLLTAQFSASEP
jgi:hypothetical protein